MLSLRHVKLPKAVLALFTLNCMGTPGGYEVAFINFAIFYLAGMVSWVMFKIVSGASVRGSSPALNSQVASGASALGHLKNARFGGNTKIHSDPTFILQYWRKFFFLK